MRENPTDSADLRQYLEPYWRRRWLVLAIIVLVPAAVYGISKLVTKTYEASTILLVRDIGATGDLFTNRLFVSTGTAEGAARVLETTTVAEQAAQELGEPSTSAGALLDEISTSTQTTEGRTGDFLTITARASTPDRAADVASAFVIALNVTGSGEAERGIDATIKALKRQARQSGPNDAAEREQLGKQLQELRGLRATQSSATQVIEPAIPPSSAVAPKPARNTALALVFAILLAAGAVPIADRINRRLRDPGELALLADAQLLAMIPESAFPGRPPSPAARESFQTLRAALRYFNLDRPLAVIVVVSPTQGDGKTAVATQLSAVMARNGDDVVLVDADLRQPAAATRLGVEAIHGVESVLVDGVSLDDALLTVSDGDSSFKLLGAPGPTPNPSILLGSEKMSGLLAELAERSDIVIVDTPALLVVSDVMPLLRPASGVVLVAQIDRTSADAIVRARGVIGSAGGEILGTVATGARGSGMYAGQYYGYGYGGESDPGSAPPAASSGADKSSMPRSAWGRRLSRSGRSD